MCMNKRALRPWRTIIIQEWWSFLLVVAVPTLIVLMSLYRIGVPQDFEVWQYSPPAIPTLAVIEYALNPDSPQTVQTNHLTLALTWMVTGVVPHAQYAFIVLYVLATVMTAVTTYIVARLCGIESTWSMVLAIAFTMAPARFWFDDISLHWWMAMPITWLITFQWWYQPLGDWRALYRRAWPLLLIPWLGWETLWWSVVALLFAALIAAVTRTDWSWRQVGYSAVSLVGMTFILQSVYPIQMPAAYSDGVRLLEFVVPHRTHWVPWLAHLGVQFHQLEIPHTSTVYAGVLALCGLVLLTIRAARQLGTAHLGDAQRMFTWIFGMFLCGAIDGVHHIVAWMGVVIPSTQPVQLFMLFGALVTMIQWLQTHSVGVWCQWVAVPLVLLVMGIDQVPSTNIMRHMRENPREIRTTRSVDGIWFGQQSLPTDVVNIQGVSIIEPGYGRWSDAGIADRVQITMRNPFVSSVTLEIRARGVAANIGRPITVRIGTEEQFMVLDNTIKSYLLTFERPSGTTIEVIPQRVSDPPAGDTRRIGVFIQSVRVVNQ